MSDYDISDYDIYIITTYQDDNVLFLSTDELKDEEKDFIRNVVYQHELLEIFNIAWDEWNQKILEKLYERLIGSEIFCELMKKISAETLGQENMKLGLAILYSYQYMYLMHKCVSDYLRNGEIDFINLKNLQDKLADKLE